MKIGILFLCFVVLSIGLVSSQCLAGQSYVIGDEDLLQVSVWGNSGINGRGAGQTGWDDL